MRFEEGQTHFLLRVHYFIVFDFLIVGSFSLMTFRFCFGWMVQGIDAL